MLQAQVIIVHFRQLHTLTSSSRVGSGCAASAGRAACSHTHHHDMALCCLNFTSRWIHFTSCWIPYAAEQQLPRILCMLLVGA
jgi:hypothetical protein